MTQRCLADALWAINAVLVVGRVLAYEKAPHEDLAEVFDAAEILPILLLDDADQTTLFRAILEGLVDSFPQMQQALDRFDGRGHAIVRG